MAHFCVKSIHYCGTGIVVMTCDDYCRLQIQYTVYIIVVMWSSINI